jgi:hypothetical protein
MICRKIKCKDCLADEGDPVWCYRAGIPAEIALLKCPKVAGKQNEPQKTKKKNPGGAR